MSDPRSPLAPACPDDDSTILEPDLDYYRGCYEDVSRDFWFLLGVIRKARDMVRSRGTTQIKTSELLDVLGRDDKGLLHGPPSEARGGLVLTAEEEARAGAEEATDEAWRQVWRDAERAWEKRAAIFVEGFHTGQQHWIDGYKVGRAAAEAELAGIREAVRTVSREWDQTAGLQHQSPRLWEAFDRLVALASDPARGKDDPP